MGKKFFDAHFYLTRVNTILRFNLNINTFPNDYNLLSEFQCKLVKHR